MEDKYRISRWCKHFVKNNTMALFHSISLAVIFVPEETGKLILSQHLEGLSEDLIKPLVQEKLIVPVSYNEMDELIGVRNRLLNEISLEMMYLILTDCCNLRCIYCFEDSPSAPPDFKGTFMSSEIAQKALRKFSVLTKKHGNSNKRKIIQLYGGEPLLNPELVYKIILDIGKLKKEGDIPADCIVAIITNGMVMSEDMARFLVANKVNVGISIDGPRDLNNLYRISENAGMDVFERAKSSYCLLKQFGVNAGISVTLTPEVIKNSDAVLDFFLEDLRVREGISFNILHFSPAFPVGLEYFKASSKFLINAFEKLRIAGIYEERMMRKAQAFIDRETMYADCGVIGNQIVVAPDGRVGVCQDFIKSKQYFGGSVLDDDYDPVFSGLFEDWKKRSPLFMEKCFDCEALGICGGGCPASVELKTGNRWNIDERVCYHSKDALEWLIWDAFSQI
ncbi:MAG: SPASM domain-containing protein [bacterium]